MYQQIFIFGRLYRTKIKKNEIWSVVTNKIK